MNIRKLRNVVEDKNFSIQKAESVAKVYLREAETDEEMMLGDYWMCVAYDKEYKSLLEQRERFKIIDEQYDFLTEDMERINELISYFSDKALEYMEEDDELISEWKAELTYFKAKSEHRKENYLDAVRLAIQAMPYATDDDDKEALKSIISRAWLYDLHGEDDGVQGGYRFSIGSKVEYMDRMKATYCTPEEEYRKMSSKDREMYRKFDEEMMADVQETIDNGPEFFSNRPYHERQFIFTVRDVNHIGGCYDATDNIKYVIPIDEMPGDITFPLGHPQPNTLYYAHPLKPHYLPMETAKLQLFQEKVQETCRLFQCLGATEITVKTLSGHKVSEAYNGSLDAGFDASFKGRSASGAFSANNSMRSDKVRKDEMSLTQTFSPTKAPYCPDDLLWAAQDPEMQTFIKQRLEGGLLKFTKRISSFETMNVASSQMMDVKCAFNVLMANVSANFRSSSDRTFSETMETEWELSVVFKPTGNGQGKTENKDTLTPVEQEYISEFLFACETGTIGSAERRFLERARTKLGISDKRAKELEEMAKGASLTDEEKEYIELFKEYAPDGRGSDRVRRILVREAGYLGISEKRAKEIEMTIK